MSHSFLTRNALQLAIILVAIATAYQKLASQMEQKVDRIEMVSRWDSLSREIRALNAGQQDIKFMLCDDRNRKNTYCRDSSR